MLRNVSHFGVIVANSYEPSQIGPISQKLLRINCIVLKVALMVRSKAILPHTENYEQRLGPFRSNGTQHQARVII